MSLAKEIEQKFIQAFKEKQELPLNVLRMLKTAIKNKSIELKKNNLEDNEIIQVVKSEVKKRKESIETYKQGGRQDLADKEQAELEMLQEFLPAQMSEDQVRAETEKIIATLSDEQKENFGLVMGKVMGQLKDKAEGGLVKQIVNQILEK